MKRSLTLKMPWSDRAHRLSTDESGIYRICNLVRSARVGVESQASLAKRAGVCASTVSRLENYKTRSPHFRTVVDLLNAIGFDVTSHAKGRADRRAS